VSRVAEAVVKLHHDSDYTCDPAMRGPVPLQKFFREVRVQHFSLGSLSQATIAQHLLTSGAVFRQDTVTDMLEDATPLAGLCFRLGTTAICYVREEDILPRRRFTAAHELGHALMHQLDMGRFLLDEAVDDDGRDTHQEIEKEANDFAAALLMPEIVLRRRAEELRTEHGTCPRQALSYRLASELLVSNEAMRYRLKNLGVGDE